jgi:hypothetical protein
METGPEQVTQVEYSSNLLTGWTTFTNIITEADGAFSFIDNGPNADDLPPSRFYQLRSASP